MLGAWELVVITRGLEPKSEEVTRPSEATRATGTNFPGAASPRLLERGGSGAVSKGRRGTAGFRCGSGFGTVIFRFKLFKFG